MIKSALVFNNPDDIKIDFYSKVGSISALFGTEPIGSVTIERDEVKPEFKLIAEYCRQHPAVPVMLFLFVKDEWQFIGWDYAIEPSDVEL